MKQQESGMIDTVINDDILRNLEDAGCDGATIELFCQYTKDGNENERLELLSRQRKMLLENVHKEESKISNLDYLIYNMTHKA